MNIEALFYGILALISLVVLIVTVFFLMKQIKVLEKQAKILNEQIKESKNIQDCSILQNIYERVEKTHSDRANIFDRETYIKNPQNFEKLKKDEKNLYQSIRDVSNCYHYIGMLIYTGILNKKEIILEEGGRTIIQIGDIILPFVRYDGKKNENPDHKQYFEKLYLEAKEYKKNNKI